MGDPRRQGVDRVAAVGPLPRAGEGFSHRVLGRGTVAGHERDGGDDPRERPAEELADRGLVEDRRVLLVHERLLHALKTHEAWHGLPFGRRSAPVSWAPMSEVTCPRCTTRQPIGAHAQGYTCVECGTEWVFATCDSCGDRFHMHPGTRAWTCPTCGTAHGAVPAVPTRAAPAGRDQPRPTTGAAAPDPATTGRRSQPPMGPILAVAGIVLVVAVAFLLTRGGGERLGDAERVERPGHGALRRPSGPADAARRRPLSGVAIAAGARRCDRRGGGRDARGERPRARARGQGVPRCAGNAGR